MVSVDWQAWLQDRAREIQACRSHEQIETFRDGMRLSYEASEHTEGWRVPDDYRRQVATLVVQRQQEIERAKR